MPKLERLDWVTPLSEGRGVTLSNMPEADEFLAADPNALLLGVLYDSQYETRRAFAIPYRLRERLGHFDIRRMANEPPQVQAAFTDKPALHRFPNRCADLTCRLAEVIVERYQADVSQVWLGAKSVDELAERLMGLPAFGPQKTSWTVGMLGRMGVLSYVGWEEFRIEGQGKPKSPAKAKG